VGDLVAEEAVLGGENREDGLEAESLLLGLGRVQVVDAVQAGGGHAEGILHARGQGFGGQAAEGGGEAGGEGALQPQLLPLGVVGGGVAVQRAAVLVKQGMGCGVGGGEREDGPSSPLGVRGAGRLGGEVRELVEWEVGVSTDFAEGHWKQKAMPFLRDGGEGGQVAQLQASTLVGALAICVDGRDGRLGVGADGEAHCVGEGPKR
jgi:hypothetical protein